MSTTRTVAIIDGGGANIASLRYALERLGHNGVLTRDPALIRAAPRVILPGVGAAAAAMERLREYGLDTVVRDLRQPLLGICLGLQLLFESSAEDNTRCLGMLPGQARRFLPAPGRPVPHMGWNALRREREHPLLDGLRDGEHVYFVHSYWCDAAPEDVIATCEYGLAFPAMVARGNVMAAQFHPEKSQAVGLRMVDAFVKRVVARQPASREVGAC